MGSTLGDKKGEMSGEVAFEIYYEDTDLSGFVYHANYLKYFERAREHIIGTTYLRDLYDRGVHFVVSKARLDFLAPARHADTLIVKSTAPFSQSPAVTFDQKAYKKTDDGEVPVASGEVTIVALNKENRPIRMPNDIIEYFQTRKLGATHE